MVKTASKGDYMGIVWDSDQKATILYMRSFDHGSYVLPKLLNS